MSKPRSLCQAVLVSMSLFMLANNTFAKPTSTNQNMASTTPSDASLIQLAKLSNFEKEFQNGVKQGFLSSVSASVMQDKAFQKLTPEQQNRVQKILEDFSEKILAGINTPELSQQALDGYVKTAKKYFTQDEVNALSQFYNTPIGQSIVKKQSAFMTEYTNELVVGMMQDKQFNEKMENSLKQYLPELKQQLNPLLKQ
ncbi:DUF2059 domain-containing protein [Faucicola mancuniensis]|uniref:DUF2059 domain-containing protein n=1 Tax=Faucicola mancuniensis TaxID=1309795 RepID=UPI0028ED650D|nr:DUF2059 domain-containing protein [uncultured Moraxella sp.]